MRGRAAHAAPRLIGLLIRFGHVVAWVRINSRAAQLCHALVRRPNATAYAASESVEETTVSGAPGEVMFACNSTYTFKLATDANSTGSPLLLFGFIFIRAFGWFQRTFVELDVYFQVRRPLTHCTSVPSSSLFLESIPSLNC